MQIRRIPADFRITERLHPEILGTGEVRLYRVARRNRGVVDVAGLLAKLAGVERSSVSWGEDGGREGTHVQHFTVTGGVPVEFQEEGLRLTMLAEVARPLQPEDVLGKECELVVRAINRIELARLRRNVAEVQAEGLPNYFDDAPFFPLRHGQGFVVRSLLRGDWEGGLRALLCSPSAFGPDAIEAYKRELDLGWGDWTSLVERSVGRRGEAVFRLLARHPQDFQAAFVEGVSKGEQRAHWAAWSCHLWNRCAALRVRKLVGDGVTDLPGDEGLLPVLRGSSPASLEVLRTETIPVLGPGFAYAGDGGRYYRAVLMSEDVDAEAMLAACQEFLPPSQDRNLGCFPQHLRASPAELDERDIRQKTRKLRLRFHLPSGADPVVLSKRLAVPEVDEPPGFPVRVRVGRMVYEFPLCPA